jgi:hypothetical protein
MVRLLAETHIPAPPDAVWEVLSDVEGWGSWNDVMRDGRCRGGVGSTLRVTIDTGSFELPIAAKIVAWSPGEELAWGVTALGFTARHGFRLHGDGETTRLQHYEDFGGVFGTLLGWIGKRRTEPRYRRFNEALRDRLS